MLQRIGLSLPSTPVSLGSAKAWKKRFCSVLNATTTPLKPMTDARNPVGPTSVLVSVEVLCPVALLLSRAWVATSVLVCCAFALALPRANRRTGAACGQRIPNRKKPTSTPEHTLHIHKRMTLNWDQVFDQVMAAVVCFTPLRSCSFQQ